MPIGDQTLAQQGYHQDYQVPQYQGPQYHGSMGPQGYANGQQMQNRPLPLTMQQYQQFRQRFRQQPNPMMGFNPLMGGYGGGMGRFDGSQMPQFAGPDPAMGGPDRGRMSFFGTPGFGFRGPDNGPTWEDFGTGMEYLSEPSQTTANSPQGQNPYSNWGGAGDTWTNSPEQRADLNRRAQIALQGPNYGNNYGQPRSGSGGVGSYGQSGYYPPGFDLRTAGEGGYSGGGGYQQPSQGYGNIAALFSQLFGGGGQAIYARPDATGGGSYGRAYTQPNGMFGGIYGGGQQQPNPSPYGPSPFMGGSMFGTGSFGGQGGSPFNSYNPFGNMMGSSGPNPLMGGFSSPGGGMFGGQGFWQGGAPQQTGMQAQGFGQNPYNIPSSQLTQMFGPNWNVMQNR